MRYDAGLHPHAQRDEPDESARAATAEYIAAMTAELTKMALARHLEMLAYLLDMARIEAESAGRTAYHPHQ